MGLPLNLALGFLIAAGLVFANRTPPEARPSPEEIAAVYERQLQRGVAEKILALNEVGKFEALALYRYKLAMLHDKNDTEVNRQAFVGGIFNLNMGRMLKAIDQGDRNEKRRKAAEAEYASAMQQVRSLRAEILARPSDRYVVRADLPESRS